MQRYIIEREIPGAGALGEEDIANISKVSNGVLDAMHSEGAAIEWVESYAAGDKIYCIYDASSEEAIREHANRGGFPANSIVLAPSIKKLITPADIGVIIFPLIKRGNVHGLSLCRRIE